MKDFNEFVIEQEIPLPVRVAEEVVVKVLKKFDLSEDTKIGFINEKLTVTFKSACSSKTGKQLERALNKAGLRPVFED